MSRFSLRFWGGCAVTASLVLGACSSSDSSSTGIRTRNSATVDACILVTADTDTPEVTARLANPGCGTALVDMTAIPAPRKVLRSTWTYLTPRLEHVRPRLTEMTSNHGFAPYRFAYEARNAENNPTHYVEVINAGQEGQASEMVLKYATVFEVSPSDSCLKAYLNPIAYPRGFLAGANFRACGTNNRFLVYQGGDKITLNHQSNSLSTQQIITQLFSMTVLSNGFPTERVTVLPLGNDQFEYRYHKFTQPIEVRPFVAQLAAAPDTTIPAETTTTTDQTTTTTVTADTSVSTVPTESTSTTSSTTSVVETSTTSTTTTTTTTSPPATTPVVAAATRTIEDACKNLEGVEVYPGFDTWTSSTRFEITISNDCMKYPTGSPLSRIAITARNTETGEVIYFPTNGDRRNRVTANGRLYGADWEFKIRQDTIYQTDGEGPQLFIAEQLVDVTVENNPAEPWTVCAPEHIVWDGTNFSLDCDHSGASVQFFGGPGFSLLEGDGTPIVLTQPPGWNPATIHFRLDGFRSSMNAVLCATDCGTLPNNFNVTTAIEGSTLAATIEANKCIDPGTSVYYHQARKVNDNLMVFNRSVPRSYEPDGYADPRKELNISLREGTDHLMVYAPLNRDCERISERRAPQLTIVAAEAEQVIEETPEPVQDEQPTPARVTTLEFSREDTFGSPIEVEENQTSVLLTPADIPLFLGSPESGVTEVEILSTNDEWRPLAVEATNLIPIDDATTEIKVKYIFADGTESIVTKPIVSPSEITTTNEGGSSSTTLIVVVILSLLAIAAGGFTIVRRKA